MGQRETTKKSHGMASLRTTKTLSVASLVLCKTERRHTSLIIMPQWEQEVWSSTFTQDLRKPQNL